MCIVMSSEVDVNFVYFIHFRMSSAYQNLSNGETVLVVKNADSLRMQ